MRAVRVHQAGPGVTLQDKGRPGFLSQGLSRGGAADQLALAEGAALLRQPVGTAVELAGFGGRFEATEPLRFALSGAPMRATLDGAPLAWHASHDWPAGAILDIGAAVEGVYGYLTLAGDLHGEAVLGALGAHLAAGLGAPLQSGDLIEIGPDTGARDGAGLVLDVAPRWSGGILRVLPSLQTELFPADQRARFEKNRFTRDSRGNRMGIRLLPEGEGFGLDAGQSILSEVITPGDIQVPGDGAPYVLLAECQTTGGYPRIGTVIPADMAKVAQCPPGARLGFRFVTRDEALAAEAAHRSHLSGRPRQLRPRLRDPRDMPDLLSYSLISGVTAGEDLP